MGLFLRSANSISQRPRHHVARHRPLRVMETLERRLALAGVFFENFSSDADPATRGFDSWDADPGTVQTDAFHILNNLPAQMQGFIPDGSFGVVPGTPGEAGWGLFADGHVLRVTSFGGQASVTFTWPSPGSAGGPAAGEEVNGVGISVLGQAVVQIFAANGTLTSQFDSPSAWQRFAADRDDLLPNGIERAARFRSSGFLPIWKAACRSTSWRCRSARARPISRRWPPTTRSSSIAASASRNCSIRWPMTSTANGDPFEIISHNQPDRGTLTELSGGYRYRASDEFVNHPTLREDSFEYTIRDSQGATAKAKVHFLLNHQPWGEGATYEQPHATTGSFDIDAPGLRGQLHDADGDPLTLRLAIAPEHGSLVIRPDGSFTYTPAAPDGRAAPDAFWFVANDGYEGSELIRVDIRHANAAPSVTDHVIHVDHGTAGPLHGVLHLNDADGDPLDLTILDPAPDPSHAFFRTERHVHPERRAVAGGSVWRRAVRVLPDNWRSAGQRSVHFSRDRRLRRQRGGNSSRFACPTTDPKS